MSYLANLPLALPELWLAVSGMALLMLGVFSPERVQRTITILAVLVFVIAAALVVGVTQERPTTAFAELFVNDRFGAFMKLLVLAGSALSLILSLGYNEHEKMARFEYPVLFVFATLGMLMMVSANDLIALYLGLELQNLALYVAAAFQRDSLRSTEAGLKYFVLGALSSGLYLYGASFIYGFSGTTRFPELAALFAGGTAPSVGVVIGIAFVASALAFKVSAVPFHMWTPDVYEGAPTPVTAFFAVAPKIAAIALFVRVLIGPFGHLVAEWQQIIVAISIASMALGAYAAINQRNIKRLMAYSSIANVGYALVGLAAGSEAGVRGVMIYMAIYLVMVVGAFGCILCMREKGSFVEGIGDLAGLARTQPLLAAVFAVFLFSLAGVPPLAGFFGKLYVFLAAIEAKLYTLAVIGVLTSVVGAYYYVRIVKVMYFDEPVAAFERPISRSMSAVLTLCGLLILLFFAYPAPLLAGAKIAAAALFPGMSGAPRLPPGFRLVALARCGSTSDEARRLAEQGAAEGTLVWAREQTAGRGRRGRAWQSPPGNLYFSLVLRPRASMAEAACLGMVAAVAVAEALGGFLPPLAEVHLRWPNDVLVRGAKVSGILLEAGPAAGGSVAWLILGIGLNIAHHPADAAFPATSLAAEGGEGLGVEVVLEAVSRSLRRWLSLWQREGFAVARERWLAHAWQMGEMITVRLEGATLVGRFENLDASGALNLTLEDGSRRLISAGEVMGIPVGA